VVRDIDVWCKWERRRQMSANDKVDLKPLFAESSARLAAIRARKKAAEEAAKPKVVTTVSPKMAEAIKANPGSLRLSAKAEDKTTVVDRPRRTEVMEVVETAKADRLGFGVSIARVVKHQCLSLPGATASRRVRPTSTTRWRG
jgi:hypothetical protein